MIRIFFIVSLLLSTNISFATSKHLKAVYEEHCASCHSSNRLGAMGPALLPENLRRLKKKKALDVIADGRAATQMPGYAGKISKKDIQALVDYVYTPLPYIPKWGMNEIKKSHLLHFKTNNLSDKPIFKADMLNLFIVVELGDHHATVLDGDKFEPIHRFKHASHYTADQNIHLMDAMYILHHAMAGSVNMIFII